MDYYDMSEGHSFYQPDGVPQPGRRGRRVGQVIKPIEYATPLSRDIGMAVLEQRSAKNMTRQQLAERAGVATKTVERMERGEACSNLELVACVLEVLGFQLKVVRL